MTSCRCYYGCRGFTKWWTCGLGGVPWKKPKTPTNIDEAPTDALLRDTGGIRSILLAALIDERSRQRIYEQTSSLPPPPVLFHRPLDVPPPQSELSTSREQVFFFPFLAFFLSFVCNGQLIYYSTGFLCSSTYYSFRFVIR